MVLRMGEEVCTSEVGLTGSLGEDQWGRVHVEADEVPGTSGDRRRGSDGVPPRKGGGGRLSTCDSGIMSFRRHTGAM